MRVFLLSATFCFTLAVSIYSQTGTTSTAPPANNRPQTTDTGTTPTATPPASPVNSPPPAIAGNFTPGSIVSVPASKGVDPNVTIVPIGPTTQQPIPTSGEKTSDGTALNVRLPDSIQPGDYYFRLNSGPVLGSIHVEPDKVTVISVHPTTAYHGDKNTFDFDVVGTDFAIDPRNDHVLVDNLDVATKHGKDAADCRGQGNDPCLWVRDSHQMEVVNFKPGPHQGIAKVAVRVGDGKQTDPQQIVFARVSGGFIFLSSAVATALLFWLVTSIVRGGLANKSVGVRKLALWEIFVFDPETNSYSLSKFQLLLFSITFIFGYLYVLLATWLVQWQFVLPDVPTAIAGLLGISAGTTVASAGLTATRGSKGAGLQTPTGADLISSGGVVVPERFQFFVWSIVACCGFIVLLVGQDPATVNKFPEIPSGLLYVMGVSAAGYLGGKAVRKPGPVLELIGVETKTTSAPRFVLTVQGHNLDSKGRFFVDDQELGILTEKDKEDIGFKDKNLIEPTPEQGASDPNFCSQLKINIPASKMDLSKGSHNFRIVNRDGQFADYRFNASSPSILAVYPLLDPPQDPPDGVKKLPASQNVTAVIRGTNLTADAAIRWRESDKDDFTLLTRPQNTDIAAGTRLIVTINTGNPGTALLTLTTSTGDVATANVDVVPPAKAQPAQPAPPAQQADVGAQLSAGNPAPNPGTGAEADAPAAGAPSA